MGTPESKTCMACGVHVSFLQQYSGINDGYGGEYVLLIDNHLYLFKEEDILCPSCNKKTTWYKKLDPKQ